MSWQAQDSLTDQMDRLAHYAMDSGQCDAADWVIDHFPWPEPRRNRGDVIVHHSVIPGESYGEVVE